MRPGLMKIEATGTRAQVGRGVAILVVAVIVVSCASEPDPRIEAASTYVKEVTGDGLQHGGGGLQIATTDVTSDGRYARFRGTVTNRFDQRVEGIRYVVTIVGDDGKPLDTLQYEFETDIEPGRSRALKLDVESMYLGRTGRVPIMINAAPVRLGGEDVPPPQGWKE
jgi:hypothetical protein